jgi:uncharacterized protein (DUF2141 family)
MEFQRVAWFGIGFAIFGYILILICAVLAGPARADSLTTNVQGRLTVHIENVSSRGGIVRIGLYDADHYPNDNSKPTAAADVPAIAGEMIITLSDIQPGIYAIEAFQDINANGKMDMSLVGLPLEPFGFSRDARPRFHKPRFSFVSFALVSGENSQTLHLQNSVSLIATN